MKKLLFPFLLLILLMGCKSNEFNPVSGFQDKLVVMGILNNKNDIQFIKIQRTYKNNNSPANEKLVGKLQLKVIENASVTYDFKDTVIEGITNYDIYYNKEIKVKTGLSYTLEISDENYPVIYATSIAPDRAFGIEKTDKGLLLTLLGDITGYSYDYHIYFLYQELIDNIWIEKKMEVPIKIYFSSDGRDTSLIFPSIPKQKIPKLDTISIDNSNFAFALSKIYSSMERKNLRLIRCYAFFRSIESNLYGYLFKGFNDEYSIRLDQPDWSNVMNGEGVFGIISLDSTELFSVSSK